MNDKLASDVMAAIVRVGIAHNNRAGGQWLLCATDAQLEALGATLASRPVVAAPGMAVQMLAAEIVDALLADEKDGGFDLTAGMFGPAFSKLVRRWAALEYATASAPSQAEPDDAYMPAEHGSVVDVWQRKAHLLVGYLTGNNQQPERFEAATAELVKLIDTPPWWEPIPAGSCQASVEPCPDQAGCLRDGCNQTGDGSPCHRFREPAPLAGRTLTDLIEAAIATDANCADVFNGPCQVVPVKSIRFAIAAASTTEGV